MNNIELNQQFPHKAEWPNFLKVILNTDNAYEIDCEIPQELSWFAGHFPKQAVLPGVVQMNWANSLAQSLFKFGGNNKYRGTNSLKFNTMILPNQQITLVLQLNREKNMVKFTYKSEATVFSSGTLVYSTT